MNLQKFLIDIVQPAEDVEYETPKVQMVTYLVLAEDAKSALERFFNEEAGEIISRGEVVDKICIGMDTQP